MSLVKKRGKMKVRSNVLIYIVFFKDSLSTFQQQRSLIFNPNALIGLAQRGMPRVVEVSLDSRREIDNQIKKVCEEFITSCVDGAVEPLTAFLIKVSYILITIVIIIK
jgi:hypothetical protein